MEPNQFFQDQRPASASRPTAASALNQNEVKFTPSPDAVARKACFTYVNQGSLHGHELQHGLAGGGGIDCGTETHPDSRFSKPGIK